MILLNLICLNVKKNLLVNVSLCIYMIVPIFGITQDEKSLKVYTGSNAFKNQTLNVDSITG